MDQGFKRMVWPSLKKRPLQYLWWDHKRLETKTGKEDMSRVEKKKQGWM